MTSLKEWIKALFIALLVVLFIRSFCFELTVINTPSMEKSIITGDFIIINKFSYGPRFPKTVLSVPFVNQRWFSDLFSLPYFRLFGTPDVERNDVVVFNYPIEDNFPVDHRTYFVKRCMAIPGDTIEIQQGLVRVNGVEEAVSDNIQHNYFIKSEKDLDEEFMDTYQITEGGEISQNNDFSFTLNQSTADTLKSKNYITAIKKRMEDSNTWDEFVFPFNSQYKWNVDHFGPLKIPAKGDVITLDSSTICLYERIIRVYENNLLELKNDSVFINGEYASNYTIKQNYYFMMGDNRHNSQDSRHWGFVPEDHIIGKATRVFYSNNKLKQGSRFLKTIE